MQSVLLVGLGGFIGSAARYGLSRIPVPVNFPVMTMIINFLGSFAIGIIYEYVKNKSGSRNAVLFLQTGFCGGFTTFSAFSLETVSLFQNGRTMSGTCYAVLSVVLCMSGTVLGMFLVRIMKAKYSL